MTFSSVLFPAPFGPRTAMNSPPSIVKLMSFWMVLPPRLTLTCVRETIEDTIGRASLPMTSHFPSARSTAVSWLSIQF